MFVLYKYDSGVGFYMIDEFDTFQEALDYVFSASGVQKFDISQNRDAYELYNNDYEYYKIKEK